MLKSIKFFYSGLNVQYERVLKDVAYMDDKNIEFFKSYLDKMK